jgi:hypothetical protein
VLNWSGLPVVNVRPTLFPQHPFFSEWTADSIGRHPTIRLPFRSGRTSPIDARDVAEVIKAVRYRTQLVASSRIVNASDGSLQCISTIFLGKRPEQKIMARSHGGLHEMRPLAQSTRQRMLIGYKPNCSRRQVMSVTYHDCRIAAHVECNFNISSFAETSRGHGTEPQHRAPRRIVRVSHTVLTTGVAAPPHCFSTRPERAEQRWSFAI